MLFKNRGDPMIVSILDSFNALELLDQILFIILVVSLLAKWISEIVAWVICRKINTDKTHDGKCIYLDSEQKDKCSIPFFQKKYFKNRHCNKIKCPGYRVRNYTIDQIKQIYRVPFWILTFLKAVSELSAVILIVRTLLFSVPKP